MRGLFDSVASPPTRGSKVRMKDRFNLLGVPLGKCTSQQEDLHYDWSMKAAPTRREFEQVCDLVATIGLAARSYGASSARVEIMLARVARALGHRGFIRSSPADLLMVLQEEQDGFQRMRWVAAAPSGMDLDKLADLGTLVHELESGRVDIEKAVQRLQLIAVKPAPWGKWMVGLSYPAIGAGVTALLSGSWPDLVCAVLLSTVVYLMTLSSSRCGDRWADWLPLTTALMASASSTLMKLYLPELNVALVTLSAVAVLLPGYTVSLGTGELVSGQVLSGIANLTSGLLVLSKQLIGGISGMRLVTAFATVHSSSAALPIDSVWLWAFVPLVIAGLCVVFQTASRDMPGASLACLVAYGGILVGSRIGDANLGNLLGTLLVVGFVNLWSSRSGRPALIALLPALIFLVGGTIGFRGLVTMADGQVGLGGRQFLQMFIVALTITFGLMLGQALFARKEEEADRPL